MDATVKMAALGRAYHRKRINNLFEPAQIDRARKFRREIVTPSLSKPMDLGPTIAPFQFGEDRLCLGEKAAERGFGGEKR